MARICLSFCFHSVFSCPDYIDVHHLSVCRLLINSRTVYLIISYANDKKLQLSGEVDVYNALMMTVYHGSFLLVSVASITQMPGLLDF